MDDLYLDALGITDEVEALGLKGSKKRKGKKLDEDFIPDLKPLQIKDVPKVVQAMRQTQSRKVLLKLLTRVKITEDLPALRQLMRLRAFSAMTNILNDYAQDVEVCSVAIDCMMTWPLIQRNKVDDSGVAAPVQACAQSDNEILASVAKKLLEQWSILESAYRIPKRVKGEGENEFAVVYVDPEEDRPGKRKRSESPVPVLNLVPTVVKNTSIDSRERQHQASLEEKERRKAREAQIANILAQAAAAAEAAAAVGPVPLPPPKSERSSKKSSKPKLTKEEKEAAKEKQLQKLVSPVVVKCLSKYKDKMDHDTFKKHAKELTNIIAEKEKKSSSYKEGRLDSLSDEKKTKVKKFAKEYIVKIMHKLEKRHKPSSSSSRREREPSVSPKHSPNEGEPDSPTHDAMDIDEDHENSDAELSSEEPRSAGEEFRSTNHSLPSPPDFVVDPRIRRRQEGWDEGDERSRGLPALLDLSVTS